MSAESENMSSKEKATSIYDKNIVNGLNTHFREHEHLRSCQVSSPGIE